MAALLINATSGTGEGWRCPVDGSRVEVVETASVRRWVRLSCTVGMFKGETSHVWVIPSSMARDWRRKLLHSWSTRRRQYRYAKDEQAQVDAAIQEQSS